MMLLRSFLSVLFRVLVNFRNLLYDLGVLPARRLPGVVISVGNISVGGTGKSPLVIDFVRRLIRSDARPVILTRGYKSGLKDGEWQVLKDGVVVAGTSRADIRADEAIMQSGVLPQAYVVVGANRFFAANEFLKWSSNWLPTHWVLDDGFQHRQIERDIDVVVIDARKPWGPCLPAGGFRETIRSLKRATAIVLTKSQNSTQSETVSSRIREINPTCSIYEAKFVQAPLKCVIGVAADKEASYALVCCVANPKDVVEGLGKLGLPIHKIFAFADHARIEPSKILAGERTFNRIVTTEKDWARDRESFERLGIAVDVAPIQTQWCGFEPEFCTK